MIITIRERHRAPYLSPHHGGPRNPLTAWRLDITPDITPITQR
jgi:hypothetical protein